MANDRIAPLPDDIAELLAAERNAPGIPDVARARLQRRLADLTPSSVPLADHDDAPMPIVVTSKGYSIATLMAVAAVALLVGLGVGADIGVRTPTDRGDRAPTTVAAAPTATQAAPAVLAPAPTSQLSQEHAARAPEPAPALPPTASAPAPKATPPRSAPAPAPKPKAAAAANVAPMPARQLEVATPGAPVVAVPVDAHEGTSMPAPTLSMEPAAKPTRPAVDPSKRDIRQVNALIRAKKYDQARNRLDILRARYPDSAQLRALDRKLSKAPSRTRKTPAPADWSLPPRP